jgi:hypothetical protein
MHSNFNNDITTETFDSAWRHLKIAFVLMVLAVLAALSTCVVTHDGEKAAAEETIK